MDKEQIKKTREFIALVIRSWRGNMCLAGLYKSDKQLADLVGVTPVAFSRLANGTTTATLPVYHSLMVAISNTLGSEIRQEISTSCHTAAYGY